MRKLGRISVKTKLASNACVLHIANLQAMHVWPQTQKITRNRFRGTGDFSAC